MGLRELKKERTRGQLATAACDLIIERGYEATTVEDIAAAVEVSPRTFFRYFPTKEEAIVEILRVGKLDPFVLAFAARPADEPLMTSLRAAARTLIDSTAAEPDTVVKLVRMLGAAPTLRARMAELRHSAQKELAVPIAHRLGVDPAVDGRPRMIAAVTLAMVSAALEHWGDGNGRTDLAGLIDDGFDLLESGVCARTAGECPAPLG
jgi:AcrR family transcriptional regulator